MNILYASILKSRLKKYNLQRNNIATKKSVYGVTYMIKPKTTIFHSNPGLELA